MQVRSFLVLSSIVFVMWIIQSCKHDPIIPNGNNGIPGDTTEVDTTVEMQCDSNIVYFQNQIMPLIASNCAIPGCHDPITAEDNVVLDNYNNIMETADVDPFDPSDSDLYEVLTENDPDKKMPPPSTGNSLTSEQISLIYHWIQQGAENNFCDNSSVPCDTMDVSFSQDVVAIIEQNCAGCHSSGVASGGIVLETYNQIQNIALDGRLFGSINHNPGFVAMPFNQTKLSSCKVSKIKSWIDAGTPDN